MSVLYTFPTGVLEKLWRHSSGDAAQGIQNLSYTAKTAKDQITRRFLGLKGQYAVDAALGEEFNWENHCDGGIDGVFEGFSYQVKTNTKYRRPYAFLTFWDLQPLRADVAVLVCLADRADQVLITGVISQRRFYEKSERFSDFGCGRRIRSTELAPFTGTRMGETDTGFFDFVTD